LGTSTHAQAVSVPDKTVEVLVDAPSLSVELGPEVRVALASVLQSPDAHWPALTAAAVPDATLLTTDPLYAHRVENVLAVMGLVGGPRAEAALAESFAGWNALVGSGKLGVIAEMEAVRLRNESVKRLAESGSACLMESVLAGLEDAEVDVGSYEVYMQYIQSVGGGTAGVADKVKAAAVRSGRDDWPITSVTLETLENPPAPGGEKSVTGDESSTIGSSVTDEDPPAPARKPPAADADFQSEPVDKSILPAVAMGAVMLIIAVAYFRRRKT